MSQTTARPSLNRLLYLLILGMLLFSLLLRIAFTVNRELDWDEFQHLHAAWMVKQGYTLYKDFWENHTPLLYYLLAPLLRLYGDDVGVILIGRVLLSATALGILSMTYALARVSHDRKTAMLAMLVLSYMVIFAETTIEIRPDQLLVAFWLASLWICQRAFSRQRTPYFFYAGLMLGIAWLFSPKALLPYAAMTVTFLMQSYLRHRRRAFLSFLNLQVNYTVGFLVPVALCFAFFFSENALREFLVCSVLENFSYPNVYRPDSLLKLRHICFFALTLAGVVITLRHLKSRPPAARADELLFLTPTLLLMGIFFFLMPAPYNQSTLLFAPLLAIYGANALRRSLDAVMGEGENRLPSPAPMVWARSKAWLFVSFTLLTGLLIPCAVLLNTRPFTVTNAAQLDRIQEVMKLTEPADVIFDGATCYVFRPQAYFYGSLVTGIVWRIDQGDVQHDIIRSLQATGCKVVIYDERVAQLPERVQAFLKEHYAPSAVPGIHLAKTPKPHSP